MIKKIKTILTILLLLSAGKIFAEESTEIKPLNLTLSGDFGLAYGMIKEYVFMPGTYNTDDVLSRLDWEIDNFFVFNFNVDFDFYKYFYLNVNCFCSVPKKSGAMEDYDWQNCVKFRLPPEYGTQYTNYSWHENYVKEYGGFSAKIGGNIIIPIAACLLKITPFYEYQYESVKFLASNGHRTYKEEDWKLIPFTEDVMQYSQMINSSFLGIGLSFSVLDFLNIKGNFAVSPNLTSLDAFDWHYLTTYMYLDKLENLFQFKTNFQIEYKYKNKHGFFIKGFYQYLPMQKGTEYYKSENENEKWRKMTETKGGTERYIWSISVGYSYNFSSINI